MVDLTLVTAAEAVGLEPAPIVASWIIEGTPQARNKELARSRDGTSRILTWDCTAGRFHWHYNMDETVVIISGEVFITNEKGERRLGPGDMGFFPAGSSCIWHVPKHVHKFAVLRQSMPYPLGIIVRAWNKLTQLGSPAPMAITAVSIASYPWF